MFRYLRYFLIPMFSFARINNTPFIYFPRFSSPSCFCSFMSELLLSSQEPREFDRDIASLSAGSDEIFQKLNDENDYPGPNVSIEENDEKIQYKRILKRSEKISPIGSSTQDSALLQKTRIVKRKENLAPVQQFHRTPFKPNENVLGQKPKRVTRFSPRGNRPNPRDIESGGLYCVLCLSNGETEYFYRSHSLRDDLNRVTCPVLQNYICSTCGATGDSAHTLKYCPRRGTSLPKCKPMRRNAAGKIVISYN